ncbi:MAG: YraN family protein [Defluviitaleaceae bacterium]|nr:YraN family protein [Defluviitaleaceae bacterium]
MKESYNNKGIYGENIAGGYLKTKGYTILASRFKCNYGEVDIIASKDGVLVFAEVKLRTTVSKGIGALSVTKAKQQRIIRTATYYLAKFTPIYRSIRFDVLDIFGREFFEVNHIENAFYAE